MKILITGGVGFIGTNTALSFLAKGHEVCLVDNFSREGVSSNADAIKSQYPQIKIIESDVSQTKNFLAELKSSDLIIHLAAQTAVTTSITNPQVDFENNLVASFKLLEAIRKEASQATVIYASTNKVYGDLETHRLQKDKHLKRYLNLDYPKGINESQPLEFISPYGCSKGSADQYFLDYARIFGLKTVVFRQSCIYGQYQMGVEDQGWLAHFSKQFLLNMPITIYGDGYQVRDLLFVDDLVEAYWLAHQQINQIAGQAFNIGGGSNNAFSLLNVIEMLTELIGYQPQIDFDHTRSGDQHYFVADNSLLKEKLGWQPSTDFKTGLATLIDWQNRYLKQ
jgi:CDP-paratose 2-epimerase